MHFRPFQPLPFAVPRPAGEAARLRRIARALPLAFVALAGAAAAEPAGAPRVATDIAPVGAIVGAVMAGVGSPHLLIAPNASEHSYALRPSDAAALDAAALVVWVGPELTPWLAAPIASLAGDAEVLTLTQTPGLRLAPVRVGGAFEAHDHGGQAHEAADGHAEDGHGEDGHAEDGHAEDGHAEGGHAEGRDAIGGHREDGHAAGGAIDPHVWLDPGNAAAIAAAAAEALATLDPDNAALYRANAAAFATETEALAAAIDAQVAPLRGRPFVVFHDAFRYFEDRFDLPASGAIAASDADAPRPARLAEIRALVAAAGAVCVFSEPQYDPKLVTTVTEGTPARSGVLDPLGVGLAQGPGYYPALLGDIADSLTACLGN